MSNSHKKLAASLIAAALLAQMAPISVLAAEDSVSPTDLPTAVSPSDTPTFHEALKDELEFFTAVLPSYNTTTEENVISSGICGENATHTKKATYMLTSDGVLTISGETFMTSWQSPSETPWYDYRASIKSVQIDNGITHIGAYAFADCTNLTSVTISDSVHEIDKKAFSNCTSLREITIPASVHVIGTDS